MTTKYNKRVTNPRPFKEAREFVHSLELNGSADWRKFCTSGDKPDDIPSKVNIVYKKEWQGWGDWLGTGTIAPQKMKYRPFEESREFVRKLKIKNQKGWEAYCKSGNKPADIPATPERHYKDKGWKGLPDWLGTDTMSTQERAKRYPEWPEAKQEYEKLGKQFGLKNMTDWRKFSKSHRKLLDELNLPTNPWNTYSKQNVWKGKIKK